MPSPLALRQRLSALTSRAIESLLADDDPRGTTPATPAPAVIGGEYPDPLEHLRRAIAAARATDATATNPKIYSELRLLLNQLESGRVSSAPARHMTRVPPAPAKAVPARGLRAMLRRKAQAAVRRVIVR